MIPGSGWVAYFKDDIDWDVAFFDENGTGWISPLTGALRAATTYGNFLGYRKAEPKAVGIIPGTGWAWRQKAPYEVVLAVMAWVLYDDGQIKGVDVSHDGPDFIEGDGGYEPEGGWGPTP